MFNPGGYPGQRPMGHRMSNPGMSNPGMSNPRVNMGSVNMLGNTMDLMNMPATSQQNMNHPGVNSRKEGINHSSMNPSRMGQPGMNHSNMGFSGMNQQAMGLNRMNQPGMIQGGTGVHPETKGMRPGGNPGSFGSGNPEPVGIKPMPVRSPILSSPVRHVGPQTMPQQFAGPNAPVRPGQPRMQSQNKEFASVANPVGSRSSDYGMGQPKTPVRDPAHPMMTNPWDSFGNSGPVGMKSPAPTPDPVPNPQTHHTNESATSILQGFGLSFEDLEELSRYPDDQLTPENMPGILRAIQSRKLSRSRATLDQGGGRRSGNERMPSRVIEYGHASQFQFKGGFASEQSHDPSRREPKPTKINTEPATSINKKPEKPPEIALDNKISAISGIHKPMTQPTKSVQPNYKTLVGNQMKSPVVAVQTVPVLSQAPATVHTDMKPKLPVATTAGNIGYQVPANTGPAVKGKWSPVLSPEETRKTDRLPAPSVASPRIFSHICPFCNVECKQLTDWLTHQNTPSHIENCRKLSQQFPDWEPPVPFPGSAGSNKDKKEETPSKRVSPIRYDESTSSHRKRKSRSSVIRAQERYNMYCVNNKNETGKTIHITNLPDSGYTDQDLMKIIQPFGKVCNTVIVQSNHEAFLETNFREAARAAVNYSKSTPIIINNQQVHLSLAGQNQRPVRTESQSIPAPQSPAQLSQSTGGKDIDKGAKPPPKTEEGKKDTNKGSVPPPKKEEGKKDTDKGANPPPKREEGGKDTDKGDKLPPKKEGGKDTDKGAKPPPKKEEGKKDTDRGSKPSPKKEGKTDTDKGVKPPPKIEEVKKDTDKGSKTPPKKEEVSPGLIKRYKLSDPKLMESEKCVILLSNLPETQYTMEEICNFARPFGGVNDVLLLANHRKAYLELSSRSSAHSMFRFYSTFSIHLGGNVLSVSIDPRLKDLKDVDFIFANLIEQTPYKITPSIYENFVYLLNIPETGVSEKDVILIGLRFGKVEHCVILSNKKKAILHMHSASAAKTMHNFLAKFPCTVGKNLVQCSLPSKTKLAEGEYVSFLEEDKPSPEAKNDKDETKVTKEEMRLPSKDKENKETSLTTSPIVQTKMDLDAAEEKVGAVKMTKEEMCLPSKAKECKETSLSTSPIVQTKMNVDEVEEKKVAAVDVTKKVMCLSSKGKERKETSLTTSPIIQTKMDVDAAKEKKVTVVKVTKEEMHLPSKGKEPSIITSPIVHTKVDAAEKKKVAAVKVTNEQRKETSLTTSPIVHTKVDAAEKKKVAAVKVTNEKRKETFVTTSPIVQTKMDVDAAKEKVASVKVTKEAMRLPSKGKESSLITSPIVQTKGDAAEKKVAVVKVTNEERKETSRTTSPIVQTKGDAAEKKKVPAVKVTNEKRKETSLTTSPIVQTKMAVDAAKEKKLAAVKVTKEEMRLPFKDKERKETSLTTSPIVQTKVDAAKEKKVPAVQIVPKLSVSTTFSKDAIGTGPSVPAVSSVTIVRTVKGGDAERTGPSVAVVFSDTLVQALEDYDDDSGEEAAEAPDTPDVAPVSFFPPAPVVHCKDPSPIFQPLLQDDLEVLVTVESDGEECEEQHPFFVNPNTVKPTSEAYLPVIATTRESECASSKISKDFRVHKVSSQGNVTQKTLLTMDELETDDSDECLTNNDIECLFMADEIGGQGGELNMKVKKADEPKTNPTSKSPKNGTKTTTNPSEPSIPPAPAAMLSRPAKRPYPADDRKPQTPSVSSKVAKPEKTFPKPKGNQGAEGVRESGSKTSRESGSPPKKRKSTPPSIAKTKLAPFNPALIVSSQVRTSRAHRRQQRRETHVTSLPGPVMVPAAEDHSLTAAPIPAAPAKIVVDLPAPAVFAPPTLMADNPTWVGPGGAIAEPSTPGFTTRKPKVWVVGDSFVHWASVHMLSTGSALGSTLDLKWLGRRDMVWSSLLDSLASAMRQHSRPDVVVIHLGGDDVGRSSSLDLAWSIKNDLLQAMEQWPDVRWIWSDIVPRRVWKYSQNGLAMDGVRRKINRSVKVFLMAHGGLVVHHPDITYDKLQLYRPDGVHLSFVGLELFIAGILKVVVKLDHVDGGGTGEEVHCGKL